MIGSKNGLRDWVLSYAHGIHSQAALFFLSFAESSFFPVPPDVLLIAILAASAERWKYFASITLLGSVLGGLLGYFIGWGFYETIGYRIASFYELGGLIENFALRYEESAFWVIFIAAFTPIPYKVITISAGLFKVPLTIFLAASLVGRGGRFFILAFLLKLFGKKINGFVYNYFNLFSFLIILVIVLGFLAVSLLV